MALLHNKRDEDVLIYPPDGGGAVFVEAGGTVEVSTDHSKSLLEQPDNWERSKGKTTDKAGASGEEG